MGEGIENCAAEVALVRIDELKEDPLNLRTHGNEGIGMIKRSLMEFRQYKPLVVDSRTKIVKAGNGRLKAMRELGWKECWCVLVDFDRHEGLEVVDNRLNELSYWDDDSIDDWLTDVKGVEWWGVDLNKSFELLDKAKKASKVKEGKRKSGSAADETGEDCVGEATRKNHRLGKNARLCPCCGKPLVKSVPIVL